MIDSATARTPLSDTRSDTESLNADSIVGKGTRHQNPCTTDARGVIRKNPQSDGYCNINPLNVSNEIFDERLRPQEVCATDLHTVAHVPRGDEFELGSFLSHFGNDIGSSIEKIKAVEYKHLVTLCYNPTEVFVFFVETSVTPDSCAKTKIVCLSHDKDGEQLHTLVNETGDVNGKASMSTPHPYMLYSTWIKCMWTNFTRNKGLVIYRIWCSFDLNWN